MANNKVLNVIHVNRRDSIEKWQGSNLPLVYGELALAYSHDSGSGEDFISEIRAGASSGALCWKELKTFVPVFPVQAQTPEAIVAERANKVLGFDDDGMPVFKSIDGALTTIINKRSNPQDNPGQNDGLYLESDSNGYVIGINNENWEITCN